MDDLKADIATIGRIEAVPTILDVVCLSTGMGFAAIARVTEERWIACGIRDQIGFGLRPGDELELETTICNSVRAALQTVAIDDVAEDPSYRDHPTPALYGFQSYISVPIMLPDGTVFGTLCAIDPRPARVNTPQTIGMFKMFAELIAFHIEADRRVLASDAILLDERRTAELREQFIAVLGHDLRNPLASINAGIRLIARTPLDDKALGIVGMVQKSVTRMAGLIDNVLDFARGRLGDGLSLNLNRCDLEPILRHVVAELQASHPERVITLDLSMDQPIACDRTRLSQLVSNLVSNALTHGAVEGAVHVRAASDEKALTVSVSNAGVPIPPQALERLFQPFERGSASPNQQGLGLGLYIASQIARAHGGTLTATSTVEETRFVFRMPHVADTSGEAPVTA